MWPNLQFLADLVTFTEEILNGKFHFLCSEKCTKRKFNLQPVSRRLGEMIFKKKKIQILLIFKNKQFASFSLKWVHRCCVALKSVINFKITFLQNISRLFLLMVSLFILRVSLSTAQRVAVVKETMASFSSSYP